MRKYKYQIVREKKPESQGRVLSQHNTKEAAKKAVIAYKKKGYTGAIWTRKKATASIKKKARKYGGKFPKGYYYSSDARKGDFF
jgi:hypothetical protein